MEAIWCTSCADTRSTTPVATMVSASRRRTSRLDRSDIALPHFLRQVFGGAPRERDDRVRGILVGVADEYRPIGREQVADVVGLAELVQHAGLRIAAHAHGADFVDDRAAAGNGR